MTYDETVRFIEDIPKFTKKTTLAHTNRLLDELGHPEEGMKIFHVAGTNGKGSVCAYLDSMLETGGYKVGLFTSPHLIRINERFMINREPVSDDAFVRAFEKVREAVRKTEKDGEVPPTYFETLFLMGLLLFKEANVDYTILEVGMGGRLDATNVIRKPLLCVITSISLDHTQYLGTTIPEIAGEKAGIIKPGVPVVFDGSRPDASEVIRKKAEEMHSPSYELKPEMCRKVFMDPDGITFDFDPEKEESVRLHIPQIADYQMMNASLAFYAMRLLEPEHGIPVEKLQEGIAHMSWPCRMQTVMKNVVIDGAHNVDGIAQFVSTVKQFHKDHEITLLFGAVADKRYPDMIRELAEGIHPERVVTTKISGSREVSEETFAKLFMDAGVQEVFSDPSPARAFDLARSLMGDGMLFCVGSLYLAGEVEAYVSGRQTN